MDWYPLVKVLHLLCVLGWMTGIFAVPRALIYWRREWDRLGEFGPTGDLTKRIYRFSVLRALDGRFGESDLWLRVFNEISVLGAIGVLVLVVYQPF